MLNVKDGHGQIKVEHIKGSNTLEFIIRESGLSFEDFQKEFKLPEDIDRTIMLKEVAPKYNLVNKEDNLLETEDFREFIKNNLKSKN